MIIDPMLLDQQLCFALYAATHAITRCYSPGLKALGLTYFGLFTTITAAPAPPPLALLGGCAEGRGSATGPLKLGRLRRFRSSVGCADRPTCRPSAVRSNTKLAG